MAGSEMTDPLEPNYDRNPNLNLSWNSQTIRPFTANTYIVNINSQDK